MDENCITVEINPQFTLKNQTSKVCSLQGSTHQELFNQNIHFFCFCPPSDHTHAPGISGGLQRCSLGHKQWFTSLNTCRNSQTIKATYHDSWTPHTLYGVVHSSLCHLHQNLLDGLHVISWIDTFSRSQHFGFVKLVWVDVDPYDPSGPCGLAAHDGGQSNSSEPKNSTHRIFFNLKAQKN